MSVCTTDTAGSVCACLPEGIWVWIAAVPYALRHRGSRLWPWLAVRDGRVLLFWSPARVSTLSQSVLLWTCGDAAFWVIIWKDVTAGFEFLQYPYKDGGNRRAWEENLAKKLINCFCSQCERPSFLHTQTSAPLGFWFLHKLHFIR